MNRIDVRWNVREQCAELVVDGRSLEEIVDPERAWGVSPFARRFLRRPLKETLATYRADFSRRDDRMSGSEIELHVCCACGDLGCGNLAVDLDLGPEQVTWSRPHWAADDDEPEEPEASVPGDPLELMPQELVFARAEYDRALAKIEAYLSRPGWRQVPKDDPENIVLRRIFAWVSGREGRRWQE